MVHGLHQINRNVNNGITLDQFVESYALYTFDLTADFDHKQKQSPHIVNTRLELKFAAPLAQPVTAIIYSIFDREIQIDKAKRVFA